MFKYLFVGLGNPGVEYEKSRHSVGRMILQAWVKTPGKEAEFSPWVLDKKINALSSKGEVDGTEVRLILPETFMNNSGKSVKPLITNLKKAHNLVVIHDDVDLPLGKMKICFDRGSGGHRGLESIIKAIKTREFIRVKVGVSPKTPSGKIKKPDSEKIVDFIIGNFKPAELEEFKKIIKKAKEALVVIAGEGYGRAMNEFN
ncbi:MAG: aminoacyl-tRNA hydrolase [Candidatus Vogelbacteria bacterium]|nr:aminoacyl-tRNA hydrolase [Candidatus Vogelbacteria bacterium]